MNNKWLAARVMKTSDVASNVKGITFDVSGWPGHRAGQHVDVRLTSPEKYVAERSYSIANAPGDDTLVELGVELMPDGEVSPYLWQLKPGDEIELRGPIGGHFVWDISIDSPLLLIAGGSGMVPLMCMLRLHANHIATSKREVVFMISLRTIDRLLYKEELEAIQSLDKSLKVVITLTDSAPSGWMGYTRRIDEEMFETELGSMKEKMPAIYVCGPTKFVEAAAGHLLRLGFNSHTIKTERFGG